jgi:septum site-determining protein MinC
VAWPPVVSGGRSAPPLEVVDSQPPPPAPTSLLLDHSLRSGQSVVFEGGDVTVVGAVASGAEVIAGGSIHVYGALRGRAVAGMAGNAQARIFCRRLEAELLAIDGLYRTADDIEPGLRGRAVQAWLQGQALKIASLD